MVTLCVGTMVAGALAATVIPFLTFLVLIGSAAVLGSVLSALRGQFALAILTNVTLLLTFTQVGYALGMALLSVKVRSRSRRGMSDRNVTEDLGSIRAEER